MPLSWREPHLTHLFHTLYKICSSFLDYFLTWSRWGYGKRYLYHLDGVEEKGNLIYLSLPGKGSIEIWLESTLSENIVHFKDTGLGIRPEHLPKIFEVFFTSGTNKGTGVGLAFCKMALQILGGQITCQSEWQHFTEFSLHFPKPLSLQEEAHA